MFISVRKALIRRTFNRFIFLLGAIAVLQVPLALGATQMEQACHLLIAGGGLMMLGSAAHEIGREPRYYSRRYYWHAFAQGRLKRTRQPLLTPLADVGFVVGGSGVGEPMDAQKKLKQRLKRRKQIPVIYNAPTRQEALRILAIWQQYQVQVQAQMQNQMQNQMQDPIPDLLPGRAAAEVPPITATSPKLSRPINPNMDRAWGHQEPA